MTTVLHLAWFDRRSGRWIGEWCGDVAAPMIQPSADAAEQRVAWLQAIACAVSPTDPGQGVVDRAAWEACPPGGAVALDVTTFGWPLGDHVWHVWDDLRRRLDWPESHTFVELRAAGETWEIVANQQSHRPIRPTVPGQYVIDITGTPAAAHYGHLWGRFVRRGDGWQFEPAEQMARSLPAPARAALAAAPIDLELVTQITERERVACHV